MKVSQLKSEIDAQFARVNDRFAQVDTRFEETIATLEARIAEESHITRALFEARITEEGQTTRRHFDVVAESIRADVGIAAASAAHGQRRLDENQSEHGTFTGVLDDHELRLKALEHYRRR